MCNIRMIVFFLTYLITEVTTVLNIVTLNALLTTFFLNLQIDTKFIRFIRNIVLSDIVITIKSYKKLSEKLSVTLKSVDLL